MAQRNNWTADFAVDRLKEAATLKAAFHRTREAYWADEYKRLDKELSDTAKTEEQAITGGTQRVLRYDPGLQQLANTASQRRDAHRTTATTYEAFVVFFQQAGQGEWPSFRYELDSADVDYFFGPNLT